MRKSSFCVKNVRSMSARLDNIWLSNSQVDEDVNLYLKSSVQHGDE